MTVAFGDPPDLALRYVRPTVGTPGCTYLAAVVGGVTACVGEVIGPGAPTAPTMPGGIYGVATLPAMGEGVYRRLGFRGIPGVAIWLPPEATDEPRADTEPTDPYDLTGLEAGRAP